MKNDARAVVENREQQQSRQRMSRRRRSVVGGVCRRFFCNAHE